MNRFLIILVILISQITQADVKEDKRKEIQEIDKQRIEAKERFLDKVKENQKVINSIGNFNELYEEFKLNDKTLVQCSKGKKLYYDSLLKCRGILNKNFSILEILKNKLYTFNRVMPTITDVDIKKMYQSLIHNAPKMISSLALKEKDYIGFKEKINEAADRMYQEHAKAIPKNGQAKFNYCFEVKANSEKKLLEYKTKFQNFKERNDIFGSQYNLGAIITYRIKLKSDKEICGEELSELFSLSQEIEESVKSDFLKFYNLKTLEKACEIVKKKSSIQEIVKACDNPILNKKFTYSVHYALEAIK